MSDRTSNHHSQPHCALFLSAVCVVAILFMQCIGTSEYPGMPAAAASTDTFAPRWNTTWGGPAQDDGVCMVIGSDCIYAGGTHVNDMTGKSELAVIKYGKDGTYKWSMQWNNNRNTSMGGLCVKGDWMYAAGCREVAPGDTNIALINMSTGGGLIWATNWGALDKNDVPISIFAGDFIYVLGSTDRRRFNYNFLFVKFTYNGTGIADKDWGTDYNEVMTGAAMDSTGFFTTGYRSVGNDTELILAKFDMDFKKIWDTKWNSPNKDIARCIAVVDDYVYVAGDVTDRYTGISDALLLKYNKTGALQWEKKETTPWNESIRSLSVSGADVYAAGVTQKNTSSDCLLMRFDENGALLFSKSWDSGGEETIASVGHDSTGLFAVGAVVEVVGGDSQVLVMHTGFDGSGVPEHRQFFMIMLATSVAATLLVMNRRRKSCPVI